jgi:hypothetical protein
MDFFFLGLGVQDENNLDGVLVECNHINSLSGCVSIFSHASIFPHVKSSQRRDPILSTTLNPLSVMQ